MFGYAGEQGLHLDGFQTHRAILGDGVYSPSMFINSVLTRRGIKAVRVTACIAVVDHYQLDGRSTISRQGAIHRLGYHSIMIDDLLQGLFSLILFLAEEDIVSLLEVTAYICWSES